MGGESDHEPEAPARLERESPEEAAPFETASVQDLLRGVGIKQLARAADGDPERVRLLLGLQRAAGNAAVARLLRQIAPPSATSAAARGGRPLLVDEDATPGAGQMRKDEFLERVRAAVLEVAEAELSDTVFSAATCPWIAHWIGYYRDRSAQEVEEALERYAPAARQATSAQDAVGSAAARVSRGIADWRTNGTLPADAASVPGATVSATTAHNVLARSPDPNAVIEHLGPGRPLRPAERSGIAGAFAANLNGVRIHDDAHGGDVARGLGAHALAVGQHVAFAPGRYEPGTPIGDALLAHELAHVAQQRSPGPSAGAAELQRDADITAAGALARLLAGPDIAAARPARASRLSLQRCGDDVFIPPLPAQRTYDEVMADLRRLAQHKQAVAQGREAEDRTLLATEADLVVELQRMGIRLEAVEIASRVIADPNVDLRRVRGRILQRPEGEVHWGQRLTFQAELDYVPPGRSVEYEWRWKAGHDAPEFQFGQAPGRGGHSQIEIGEGFWLTERDGRVGHSRKVEIVCRVYLGSERTRQDELTTGEIEIKQDRVPNPLTMIADPPVPVVGGIVRFSIADWAPEWTRHELTWEVDGRVEGQDTVGFRRSFSTAGTHTVAVRVNEVRRSFGVRERTPLTNGRLELPVQDVKQASTQMLDQMQPGTSTLPATRDLERSLETSIAEIERHAAEGGEQREYWIERLKVQRRRLAALRSHAFDLPSAEALPVDPAALVEGHAYNGPIAAVLSMPEGRGVQPLTIQISAHREGDQWVSRLIDMTSKDVFDREGRGRTPLEAHRGAFRAWINDHPYPRGGTVTYRFPAAGWDVDTSFRTKDTAWDTAVAWLDGIVTVGGFIAAGLLLAAPEATVTKWLGYTMLVMSAARSGVAIYENLNSGVDLTDSRNVIEGVSILTSFLGAGGSALRSAGIRNINPAMYRFGNWVMMTGLAADAGTLVFATSEAVGQLRAVQADPTLDEGQKAAAIVRLISTIALRQALFFVSNRGLLRQGLRPSDFVRTDPRLAARVGRSGQIELSTGSRLDLALEFRRAGDTHFAGLAASGRVPASEILDRHAMLPWLKTLPAAEIADVSRRLTTAAMSKLQGIRASDARAAMHAVGDDALFNRLAVAWGGPRVQTLGAGLTTIKATLGADPQRLALLNQAAEAELRGTVVGFEQWVQQTASRVTPSPTAAQRAEQLADVQRLTGELSALQAVAAQSASVPGAVVRFNPAPTVPAGTPTPRSFDIHVETRPVAGGGAPTTQRLIEVETVLGPVRSAIDLHGGIAHAASKLPLARPRPGAGGPREAQPDPRRPDSDREQGGRRGCRAVAAAGRGTGPRRPRRRGHDEVQPGRLLHARLRRRPDPHRSPS